MSDDNQADQLRQQIQQLESIVKPHLERKAVERLGNIKLAHPEKYVQTLALLAQMFQSGKIDHLDDDQLKSFLKKISPKRSFNIRK